MQNFLVKFFFSKALFCREIFISFNYLLKKFFFAKFLATMSSSRSDDVTKCVCLSELIFFSLEHSKHFKQDVSQECPKDVSRVFQECSKGNPSRVG